MFLPSFNFVIIVINKYNVIMIILFFGELVQDPRVLDAMMPYSVSYYGNPHSRTHAYGWESEQAVEHARKVYSVYIAYMYAYVVV